MTAGYPLVALRGRPSKRKYAKAISVVHEPRHRGIISLPVSREIHDRSLPNDGVESVEHLMRRRDWNSGQSKTLRQVRAVLGVGGRNLVVIADHASAFENGPDDLLALLQILQRKHEVLVLPRRAVARDYAVDEGARFDNRHRPAPLGSTSSTTKRWRWGGGSTRMLFIGSLSGSQGTRVIRSMFRRLACRGGRFRDKRKERGGTSSTRRPARWRWSPPEDFRELHS